MKKLLFMMIVATFSLSICSVAIAAPGVIAGNDVIDRTSGPDSWANFYLMDRNNGFSEDSFMTGFSVYIKEKNSEINPFEFLVYAETIGGWEVVYRSGVITPVSTGVYNETIDPVYIPAGSYVGLYYPEQGAVPYTNGPLVFSSGLSLVTLFTAQGGEEVDFLYSDDRTYSIAAIGYAVSEYEARITGGGQIITETGAKKKDWYKISFGVGAYRIDGQCFLECCDVTFHNVSNDGIDKWKFVATELTEMNFFEDGVKYTPGSVANFTVLGYLEDEDGESQGDASMIIRLQDSDEPGFLDNIRFELYQGSKVYDSYSSGDFPGQSNATGTARTYLDRGNLQVEDLTMIY
ncbi:MAG: hypothetical protein JW715_11530 [Sedimentisphaerales bacterium]|nr:hypothetical protein [Sedimentisphaerales bacterium]